MMQSDSSIEDVFRIRKLEISDKDKGFIELLRQLTVCDSVSDEKFKERFEEIAKYGDDHRICVIEAVRLKKLLRPEVCLSRRSKRIVEYLADHAYSMWCYKVILDCTEE
ncbi:hypothetical protein RND71_038992 [Anisodus tanguticus]|uniref:Glucosamine 6-phosphate N-acetyltransferase n=1 Tax=Anisodus tanguticus TaxID=243964 RepID=A0AAE1R1A0_9SOLA|nr:hypothetical protein RND71_038992 [Anisodus tanguticus]